MRPAARPAQHHLANYSEAELRAAHAELVDRGRLKDSFAKVMADPLLAPFVRCRAYDRRNRQAAERRGRYVPAAGTDIRRTIAKVLAESRALGQRGLDLESRA